jgi:hypothetical protein
MVAAILCSLSLAADPGRNRVEALSSSWKFQSRLLTNATVQAMVDSVSAQEILNNVRILVSYYTRHTNSETTSANFGVGAARRWIISRFEDISADSNTFSLEPSYFNFNATICGIPREHKNILAALSGTTTPQRHFIVMGHFDSRTVNGCDAISYAPSANDDGSGTAVVVEMARVMSRYPFESTIIIMPVTGEDEGLYGSGAYAQWAQNQGMRIDGVITNDVVGNIEGCANPSCPPGEPVIIDSLSVRHFSGTPDTGVSRQLARYMKLKAMEYVPDFNITLISAIDRPGRSGDHVPFYQRGYPGVRFTEAHEYGDGSGSNGRQHNAHDTISAINTNAGYMANIARINIAGIACLALAPQTPTGALTTFNIGDGSSVLLTWPDENNEPDFAGYRIAVRPQGELFYTNVIDAGNQHSYIVTGLNSGQRVYLSISGYDMDDNESVFTPEISFTPASVPLTPGDFNSTSHFNGVSFGWTRNTERDMMSYRIFRRAAGQVDTTRIADIPHPITQWFDSTAIPHILYAYYIAAVDSSNNQSGMSTPAYGQLASHDNGIIIVDGTLDGGGSPLQPTDQQVDDYFDAIFSGYDVTAHWDIVDSNAVNKPLSDAFLAPHSTVFFHCERLNTHLEQDTTVLRKHLENGGRLILSGWNLSYTLAGNISDYVDFLPGDFFREFLKVDSLGVSPSSNRDFVSAPSLMPSIYPDLIVDSIKVSIFEHRIPKMEAFLGPLLDEPLAQPLNSYSSSMGDQSPLNGRPVSLRYLGNFRLVLFDAPLFFMTGESAAMALQQALSDLGEPFVGIDQDNIPHQPDEFFIYGNYPNPFNSSTYIRYHLSATSDVAIGIFDILGRESARIINTAEPAGDHQVLWSPEGARSGLYFCKIEAGRFVETKKMLLLR